jgi:hypothetical protein
MLKEVWKKEDKGDTGRKPRRGWLEFGQIDNSEGVAGTQFVSEISLFPCDCAARCMFSLWEVGLDCVCIAIKARNSLPFSMVQPASSRLFLAPCFSRWESDGARFLKPA